MPVVLICLVLSLIVSSSGGALAVNDGWQSYAREWLDWGSSGSSHQELYYPYFGENFFTSGYAENLSDVQSIEAQRRSFESPFRPYFGDWFLSGDVPYQFTSPWDSVYYYGHEGSYLPYQYPWSNRLPNEWPSFQKNWTATMRYAQDNSSFRVWAGGAWKRA